MKVGLIIASFNRPKLLWECLDSIRRTGFPAQDILIVDDASTDFSTNAMIAASGYNVYSKPVRKGIKDSLMYGYDYFFNQKGYDLVINLDGDAVIRNDGIGVLLKLKEKFPDNIVGGFNTIVRNRNPIIEIHKDYFLKKYASGINICINKEQYEKYVKPALLTPVGNWDYMASQRHEADGKAVVVSNPSVVQHGGIYESAMGHISATEPPDVAEDFKPLHLPNVTLIGATGDEVKRAVDISCKYIEFGGVKILSPLSSKADYNKFILKHLSEGFETSHCLLVQPDGFILNYKAWSDEFLKYDYIGAPWMWYRDNMRVGNGGFSVRSKKLCEILCADEKIVPVNDGIITNFEEDHNICRIYRKYLEINYGINFAPEEIASQFSIEAYGVRPPGNKYNGSFGFHGYGNIDYTGCNLEHIPQRPSKKEMSR